MADLYRKASLERMSNPEQLDKMVKISSPLSWLALLAVVALITVTVVWSIIGKLPTTMQANGVIVGHENACALYSDSQGVVTKIYVKNGAAVEIGDKIVEIALADGSKKSLLADRAGVINLEVTDYEPETGMGSRVIPGTEIARVTPADTDDSLLVCYVPILSAASVKPGMKLTVTPAIADAQKYGHMEAEVLFVDTYAANYNGMISTLGESITTIFTSGGSPVVAVTCKIATDENTKSGYKWSGKKGKNAVVENGVIATVEIITEENAPITKLFSGLKTDSED